MKHRSVVAFVLLAVALFAAPQFVQDLSALKSAVGARLRGEILHAFLNLPAGDGSNELVASRTVPMLSSLKAKENACPLSQQSSARKSESRTQATPLEVGTTRAETGDHLAILSGISDGSEKVRAQLRNVEMGVALGNVAELSRDAISLDNVAMLNIPDFDLPVYADASLSGATEMAATEWRKKSAEVQRRMTYIPASFEQSGALKGDVVRLQHRGPMLNEVELFRALERGSRVKVLKVMRQSRSSVELNGSKPQAPKANAQQAVPVAALIQSETALPIASCAKAGE